MKKYAILVLALLTALSLCACGGQSELSRALTTLKETDNVKINISVTAGDEDTGLTLSVVMKIDGAKIYMSMLGSETYLSEEDGVIYVYVKDPETQQWTKFEDTDAANVTPQFDILHEDNFVKEGDVYAAKPEALAELTAFFGLNPDTQGFSADYFKIKVSQNRVDEIQFKLSGEDDQSPATIVRMTFSDYGQVTLTLPEAAQSENQI